jgi:hypothetical protein
MDSLNALERFCWICTKKILNRQQYRQFWGMFTWYMRLLEEAVSIFKYAIELSPKLEAVSLGLFHCLWQLGKREKAMAEMIRYQSISDSEDYREIIKEINGNSRQ